MRRWILGLLLAFAGALLFMKPAGAAGFDCNKATPSDEKAVCASPSLSALDSEMTGLWYAYSRLPMAMGGSGERHDDERTFLAQRGKCVSDVTCLTRIYNDRIAELRSGVGGWMQTMQVFMLGAPEPAPADPLPGPVMQSIASYSQECATAGGTLTNAGNVMVLAGDIDGDGLFDYVLNPETLKCRSAATALCANNGCRISIHLSRTGFSKPIVASGGQPTLAQRGGHTVAEIWVDRSNCNSPIGSQCWAIFAWHNGAVETKHELRRNPDAG